MCYYNYSSSNSDSPICKILSFMPVVIVYATILLMLYIFSIYYVFSKIITLSKLMMFMITLIFTFMIIWCHMLCVTNNPGTVKENRIINYSNIESSYCDKCERRRPPRSHHCRSCNTCILKMDHHCPWIRNCVGLYNQKYFILFIFYTILACSLVFSGMINIFLEFDEKIRRDKENSFDNPFIDPLLIVVGTTLPIILVLTLSILFCQQIYFILNNMTNIESIKYKNKENSPFYSPKLCDNFKIVMGENCIVWFLPIFYKNSKNDGYGYYTNLNSLEEENINLKT